MIQISFVVKCKEKGPYTMKIVGDIPDLGQWEPEKGLEL